MVDIALDVSLQTPLSPSKRVLSPLLAGRFRDPQFS